MLESLFPISILDNDFYKFTMQNAVIKKFPNVRVQYNLINRGNHSFPKGFDRLLKIIIKKMSQLKLHNYEYVFLKKNCTYLDSNYLNFLKSYRYNPSEINIIQNKDNLKLIIKGFWYRVILWEVPIMSIISELYYKIKNLKRFSNNKIIYLTNKKILKYKNINVSVAEFGTRRRYSYEVQKLVVKILKEKGKNSFIGSSNVHLAHLFNIKPIGTHAHEWFMFHGAKYGFKIANQLALKNWINIYHNNLKIALSDTYTTKLFFQNFNKNFSKFFDGVRHDSGDPISFARSTIKHYKKFKIDPMSKIIMFSDNLNPKKVYDIACFCRSRIGMSFGIGTNFTNDVGLPKMNIVIKMTKVIIKDKIWTPVIKISDSKKKYSGDIKIIKLIKKSLNL